MKARVNEQTMSFTLFMLFSILLLTIIPIYSLIYNHGFPSSDTSYYHIRMSDYILKHGVPSLDPAVISETPYFFNPFDILLGLFSFIFGTTIAAIILPLLLGIITLYCTYVLLEPYFSSSKHHLLAGVFMVTCPLFLTIFSQATSLSFMVCILSLSMFILLKTQKNYLAYFLLPLISFYGIFHSIIALGFLFYFCSDKKKEKWILTGVIAALSIFLLIYWQQNISTQVPALLLIVQQLFSDLGGNYGFSIFALLLAILGITEQKVSSKEIGLVLAILGFSFFISPIYYMYLIPLLAVFATHGFFSLLQREWKLYYLQNIALFLIILGMLFSATSMISRTATAAPSPDIIQGLLWLKENSYENAIILTDKPEGFIVEEITQRRVMFDQNTPFTSISPEVSSLFRPKDTASALTILEKYQIDYIVVFADTEHPQLSLVLKSTENFKKVFENNHLSIWSVQY